MRKTFAPDIPRSETPGQEEWILFPRDIEWRRSLFPDGVFQHPAKANMFLQKALIDYLTEPGDTIIDPFGGTGTAMIGLLMGRNVALIELEPSFQALIEETYESWQAREPDGWDPERKFFLFSGDCRLELPNVPFLCDAAIFSPPYSTALSHSTGIKEQKEVLDTYALKGDAKNMGRLNPFMFQQAMRRVYPRLANRLVPDAPMALITKDIMKGPERQMLSKGIIREATRAGFRMVEWFKWKPPGSMQQSIMRSKGANVVDDEDILIFRKK
jgi:hypothetical protein